MLISIYKALTIFICAVVNVNGFIQGHRGLGRLSCVEVKDVHRRLPRRLELELELKLKDGEGDGEAESMRSALEKAKEIADAGLSPGAGLDAFASADAAYADLILTSSTQRELDLDEDELRDLKKGGRMWEKGSKSKTSKGGGVIGDIFNALSALSGGAHIVKDENGET